MAISATPPFMISYTKQHTQFSFDATACETPTTGALSNFSFRPGEGIINHTKNKSILAPS